MIAQSPAFDPVRYKQTTREQWQAAADAWRRWTPVVQTWFADATDAMIELGRIQAGSSVLEVAAGAGEPALTFAERVGPAGSVLATDITVNLVEMTAQEAGRRGLGNVEARVMDGEQLELLDASFDVVSSRVGLIYFPDQQRALAESRRVLRTGGRVVACVYTTPEKNLFFSIPVSIISRRARLPAPSPGQPSPFSLGGDGVLIDAFRRAGFRQIESRVISCPLRLVSAAECVRFERESFGALHQMLAGLTETERDSVWDEIEQELSIFDGPAGFEGPCEVIVAVGVK
jgi:SAM-dependent methyltransferase